MSVGLSEVGTITDSKAMRHNVVVNGLSIGIPLVGTLVGLVSSGFWLHSHYNFSLPGIFRVEPYRGQRGVASIFLSSCL